MKGGCIAYSEEARMEEYREEIKLLLWGKRTVYKQAVGEGTVT